MAPRRQGQKRPRTLRPPDISEDGSGVDGIRGLHTALKAASSALSSLAYPGVAGVPTCPPVVGEQHDLGKVDDIAMMGRWGHASG